MVETGKFKDQHLRSVEESQTKRSIESKTTYFGSLVSRRSSSLFYKQRQIQILHKQLEQLKEDGLRLKKDKLEKEYQYRRQMLKINNLRDDLTAKSKERFADLTELKQMFAHHKKTKRALNDI